MIRMNHFFKRFGDVTLFDDTNLLLPDNGIHFIYGANGTGKTTLFKCLTGNENYSGQILIEPRHSMYCVFDDNPFYEKMNTYQNITLLVGRHFKKKTIEAYANYMFENLKILLKPLSDLSLGQRKLISLVLLQCMKPKFILLDEIFNGMDIESRQKAIRAIRDLSQDSLILLSGHEKLYVQISNDCVAIENQTIVSKDPQYLLTKFDSLIEETL